MSGTVEDRRIYSENCVSTYCCILLLANLYCSHILFIAYLQPELALAVTKVSVGRTLVSGSEVSMSCA